MHVVIFFCKKYYKFKNDIYGRYTCISTAFFWSIKNAELILYRLVFVSHILQIKVKKKIVYIYHSDLCIFYNNKYMYTFTCT